MSNGRFLIVEDEFVVAENLRAELESLGHEVVGMASSGRDAIELAREKKPELVLMDIRLSGEIDGIDTAIHLRQHLDIPVFFLTAFADETFLERAKLSEPLGYLVKPFERRGLRAGIEMAHYKARIERLLKESESRFRSMFENSPVAYLALDISGCCLDFNTGLCQLLGYDRDELVGKNFIGLCSVETRDLFSSQLTALLECGTLQTDLELVGNGNKRISALFEGRLQRTVSGDPIRIHVILHDITGRKRAEAERLETTQRLHQIQKAESLSRMAGAIAHHFNNQLHAVIGNLEIAMEDLAPDTSIWENLNEAKKAAQRAGEVSSLLLTYLGNIPVKQTPLDISHLCSQHLPVIQARLPKDVLLKTTLPAPGPVILANSNQIRQILIHLVNNAREAFDQGPGVIHVSVTTVLPAEIPAANRYPINWQPDDTGYACLEVTDTGCGIANEDIEKLFDPFFSTRFIGRGLGLPVVLGIVRMHGGAVTVTSKPGTGSIIRVFFPLSSLASASRPGQVECHPQTQKGGTILLAEDEDAVRSMVKSVLTRLGYLVLAAQNGAEAMEIFRRHKNEIRCVITDLTMPGMNGWETLAALRNLSPDIPVILSSGYDEGHVYSGEQTESPNAFLGKPYTVTELRNALAKAMESKA